MTPDEARAFFISATKSMDADELKSLRLHTENVVKCVTLLSDSRDLIAAAWVHDVGRVRVGDGHEKESLKMVEERFGSINNVIKDCILHHGSRKNPTTHEGRIIQLCDKLSVFDHEYFLMLAQKHPDEVIAYYQKCLVKLAPLLQKEVLEE